MSEVRFEGLFTRYGKRAWLHKFEDTKELTGRNKRPTLSKVQPADYLVCHNGNMFLAEVKESRNPTSFPFGNIRDGQLAAARQVLAAGCSYFFCILQTRTGSWYRVPATVILGWPTQSMKWSELEPFRWQ